MASSFNDGRRISFHLAPVMERGALQIFFHTTAVNAMRVLSFKPLTCILPRWPVWGHFTTCVLVDDVGIVAVDSYCVSDT